MGFVDDFQKEIWESKYQYNNETLEGYCDRISKNIFLRSKKRRQELYNNLLNFFILFGGRINSNIGVEEKGLTLFNCFIEVLPKNPDSLEGIFTALEKYAVTLKSEGGVGFCANFLRPSNTIIKKVGVTTPGAIKFLEMFDRASEVITSGSVDKKNSFQGVPTKKSIRKGATMVTMSICHPDIEEFITAKSTPNKLTKMNMSVMVTDVFMYAVEEDLDWDLWFPDVNFEKYDLEWDGDFEKWAEKKYPMVLYKKIKARELWNLLLSSSHSRNEPGILFIDTIRRMDNLGYLKGSSVLATNPCSEVIGNTGNIVYEGQELALGDVCNLGSLNLTKYYSIENKEFNFEKFKEGIDLLVRSLENIIDISNYPLDMYENAAKLKRKIGVGLSGVGSLMMMMNIRYGSDRCIEVLEEILSVYINQAYQTSAILAKERGPFALYDKQLLENGFVKHSGVLTDKTKELITKFGLRNSAVACIAPNGTLSIVAGNISGGIEPVFAREYTRWNRVEGRKMDFEYPNIHKGEWFETDYLKEKDVTGETYLISTDNNYRVDKSNGLCKKATVRDYGYKIAKENNLNEVATAKELTIDDHLKVLSLFSKYVDLSCSKTINLPEDITLEEFKELYGNIHKLGVKGCTTYREGSSVAVLESEKKEKNKSVKKQQKEFLDAFKNQSDSVVVEQDIKLPEVSPSLTYKLTSEDRKWYLHVNFKDKACTKPFAIFVNTNAREDNIPTFNAIDKLEVLALHKGLKKQYIEETKHKYAYQKNPVKICRMLGLLLRHNIDVYDIVIALDEVDGATIGTFVFRLKKFLCQFIDKIEDPKLCPECGEKSLVFSEGCFVCRSCGSSKCS